MNGCPISMTQNGDPYENALAERMNRTLREELGLAEMITTKQQAKQLLGEAAALYNDYRPHLGFAISNLLMKSTKNPCWLINQQGFIL